MINFNASVHNAMHEVGTRILNTLRVISNGDCYTVLPYDDIIFEIDDLLNKQVVLLL